MKFTPTAVWRTLTSPSEGAASVMSWNVRTSAPPVCENRMAFVISHHQYLVVQTRRAPFSLRAVLALL
jgi:hypothetical protein